MNKIYKNLNNISNYDWEAFTLVAISLFGAFICSDHALACILGLISGVEITNTIYDIYNKTRISSTVNEFERMKGARRMEEIALGQVVCTKTVYNRMADDEEFNYFVINSLCRYCCGDWGETSEEDAALNDEAVVSGERILASYTFDRTNENIWIITEWDRSATTVLFPDEY